jgi:hypothetical protein
VLSALWGTPWDADSYLCSITRVTQPSIDGGCIDPRLLQLHSTRDPRNVSNPDPALLTSRRCDSPTMQHSFTANRYDLPLATSGHGNLLGLQALKQSASLSSLDMNKHLISEFTSMPSNTGFSSWPNQTSWTLPASGSTIGLLRIPPADTDSLASDLTTPMSQSPGENSISASGLTRFACLEDGCSKRFSSKKDLDRHFDSMHGTDYFRCRCGKIDARKDNHDRHVRKCRRVITTSCRCGCGENSDDVLGHLEHGARWNRRFGCLLPITNECNIESLYSESRGRADCSPSTSSHTIDG